MSSVAHDDPGGAGAACAAASLWLWRHPRPEDAVGRCIGRTDLAIDARRAKRLAHRIERIARRERLPREVWTSPLRRCADVGRALARRGYAHRIDERLLELDFGAWDGLPWSAIGPEAFAPWDADFLHHGPGGGETVAALRARVASFAAEVAGRPVIVVAHAGWVNALRLAAHPAPTPADWPRPVPYGAGLVIPNPCRSRPCPR
ncbi:histidine phosphatase family protein [Aquincola sp. MAHUQ-54]|uniref:Histidine phosphatase family protein n=1 Tax=Aquincola agrisoli TaxID=3119538 RepID=A0AAW9QGP1_9BURK